MHFSVLISPFKESAHRPVEQVKLICIAVVTQGPVLQVQKGRIPVSLSALVSLRTCDFICFLWGFFTANLQQIEFTVSHADNGFLLFGNFYKCAFLSLLLLLHLLPSVFLFQSLFFLSFFFFFFFVCWLSLFC